MDETKLCSLLVILTVATLIGAAACWIWRRQYAPGATIAAAVLAIGWFVLCA